MKLFANVSCLEIDLQRCHFTRHGQHLNNSGKELVAIGLAKLIYQHRSKVENKTIQMSWKEDHEQEISKVPLNAVGELLETNNHENPVKCVKIQNEKIESNYKKSLRTRMKPITKSNDFLW
jgi:hypothetical protein